MVLRVAQEERKRERMRRAAAEGLMKKLYRRN